MCDPAMALQPPVVVPQAANTGPSRSSPKGCRCGFTQTSAPLCLHLVSRVHSAYGFNGHGRVMHPSGVALPPASQKFFVAREGIVKYGSVGRDNVLKGAADNVPVQVERLEQPLPPGDAASIPQQAQSFEEGFNEPSLNESSSFAASDPNAGREGMTILHPDARDGATSSGLGSAQPDINSFDQNADLETLRSNVEGSIDTAGAAATRLQESAKSATDTLSTDQVKSAKEAYEELLSGTQGATDQESPIDALSQASQSIAGGLSEAKSAVVNGFTRVQASIQSSVDDATTALKSTYNSINASIISSFKHVTGLDENARIVSEPTGVKNVVSPESLVNILTSPFQVGTPVNNALKEVVSAVENITGKGLVGAGELVVNGYTSTKEVLPLNAQLYLSNIEKNLIEVSGHLMTALKQVYTVILDAEKAVGINPENPIVPILLVVGGGFSLVIVNRQLQYGGYSGDLEPASALDLLKTEGNIVLIDIRPEALRESEGIPDLRRQVRFKAASVELFKVQGFLERMLKNVADAEYAMTASAIKNLKNVQRNTKVILLDSDGSQSKSVARALKKAGIKMPYRIGGGFRAWEANGLRVKKLGPETALTIIKEETEAILDEVKPTPSVIASAMLGVIAGIYALIEWEKTLQFLGLVCIGQVLYTRLNSYDTVDDAKNDLKLLLRPFTLATRGIVWIAGALEPSKLQLATSPSTSAVQDRVLQAAAKHGPLPSEYGKEQQEDQSLEGPTCEGPTSEGLENDASAQD